MPRSLRVQSWFYARAKKLILAESCTGGRLSSALTANPGCSEYFLGSIVAYSNTLKERVLGVSSGLLERHGAVSEETVVAMAEGALRLSGADVALAVSGIAGPGGASPEKPVGLIWYAIVEKGGKKEAKALHLIGAREALLKEATDLLLDHLYTFLEA